MVEPALESRDGAIWYAFVESQDPFVLPRTKPEGREWWMQVLEARQTGRLRRPNRITWLSCIRAEYFQALPWRGEPCEVGNADEADRRRERLLSLKPGALRIMPLLLSSADKQESATYRQLGKHDWHRIRTDLGSTLPVFSAMDFDVEETGGLIGLDYLGPCTPEELTALRAVFNLNFLPDADLSDDEERGPPVPPLAPEPHHRERWEEKGDYKYAGSPEARGS
jgi:hypothetical protein